MKGKKINNLKLSPLIHKKHGTIHETEIIPVNKDNTFSDNTYYVDEIKGDNGKKVYLSASRNRKGKLSPIKVHPDMESVERRYPVVKKALKIKSHGTRITPRRPKIRR